MSKKYFKFLSNVEFIRVEAKRGAGMEVRQENDGSHSIDFKGPVDVYVQAQEGKQTTEGAFTLPPHIDNLLGTHVGKEVLKRTLIDYVRACMQSAVEEHVQAVKHVRDIVGEAPSPNKEGIVVSGGDGACPDAGLLRRWADDPKEQVLVGQMDMVVLRPDTARAIANRLEEWEGWQREIYSDNGPTNTIFHSAYDAKGHRTSYGRRSSFDPNEDMRVMTAAVELVQAIKLRNVPITPDKMYLHLVGKTHAEQAAYIEGCEAYNNTFHKIKADTSLEVWVAAYVKGRLSAF